MRNEWMTWCRFGALATVACLAAFLPLSASASTQLCTWFEDDFDDDVTGAEPDQAGWVTQYRNWNVFTTRADAASRGVGMEIDDSIFQGASGKSIRLFDDDRRYSCGLFLALDSLEVAEISMYVRIVEGIDDAVNIAFGGDGTPESEGVNLVLYSGEERIRIAAVGEARDVVIGSYQPATWNHYKLRIDTVLDVVSVWKNGTQIDGPRAIAGPGITDMANVKRMFITTKGRSTGTVWIDSVRIEEECDTPPDTTPPVVEVSATPGTLWPPNHKLRPINVDLAVSDDVDPDPAVTLTIASNEDDDAPGRGDGATTGDIVLQLTSETRRSAPPGLASVSWSGTAAELADAFRGLMLRAERQGSGDGRTYTIHIVAIDASGNESTGTTTVKVSHDRAGE